MKLSIDQYQAFVRHNWNRRREAAPQDNPLRDLYIMSTGLGGETGEVLELLKKHVRDGHLDLDDLALELGDVLHYLTRIGQQFGFEIMARNVAKLAERAVQRGYEPQQMRGASPGSAGSRDEHLQQVEAVRVEELASPKAGPADKPVAELGKSAQQDAVIEGVVQLQRDAVAVEGMDQNGDGIHAAQPATNSRVADTGNADRGAAS